MSPEQLLILVTARGVALDSVVHGGIPEWTPADAALALSGLEHRELCAVLYSFAGDQSVRPWLSTWLLEKLLAEREQQRWAKRVERTDGTRSRYAEELVALFLEEERRPCILREAPMVRAIWMRVEPETWRHCLAIPYQFLAAEYGSVLADAEYVIHSRLRGH